jgi:hypothetical protein
VAVNGSEETEEEAAVHGGLQRGGARADHFGEKNSCKQGGRETSGKHGNTEEKKVPQGSVWIIGGIVARSSPARATW